MGLAEPTVPKNYCVYDGRSVIQSGILRDGFDKKRDLRFLEVVR